MAYSGQTSLDIDFLINNARYFDVFEPSVIQYEKRDMEDVLV